MKIYSKPFLLLVLKMILQDFAHLKRYLEDCDYVFESCGVNDDRTQGLLFVLACQYRQFGFSQVLQKYVLDDNMYETCGSQRQRILS